MKYLQETTKSFPATQCHTYIVTDDKFQTIAYAKHGTSEFVHFKKPLKFSTKGRTFKEIKV